MRGGEVFVRTTPWTGPVDGSDGPRERALYVHGLGGASTNWTDLAALLAVRFDGWAVDLPGFGRSQPPPRGRYSIRGHVRAVIDVLEHIVDLPGDGAGRAGAPASATPWAAWSACSSPAAVPTWSRP